MNNPGYRDKPAPSTTSGEQMFHIGKTVRPTVTRSVSEGGRSKTGGMSSSVEHSTSLTLPVIELYRLPKLILWHALEHNVGTLDFTLRQP